MRDFSRGSFYEYAQSSRLENSSPALLVRARMLEEKLANKRITRKTVAHGISHSCKINDKQKLAFNKEGFSKVLHKLRKTNASCVCVVRTVIPRGQIRRL